MFALHKLTKITKGNKVQDFSHLLSTLLFYFLRIIMKENKKMIKKQKRETQTHGTQTSSIEILRASKVLS